jgi:hypothetical protein
LNHGGILVLPGWLDFTNNQVGTLTVQCRPGLNLTGTAAVPKVALCRKVVCRRCRKEPAVPKVLLPAALGLGLLIAYVDSRPNRDDTGITALALFAGCGLWGFLGPNRPWLWALAIGLWVPAFGIASAGNYGSLPALLIAFAGAYAGMAVRKAHLPA